MIKEILNKSASGIRLRHVTAKQPIVEAAVMRLLPHRTLARTVSGERSLTHGAQTTRKWSFAKRSFGEGSCTQCVMPEPTPRFAAMRPRKHLFTLIRVSLKK